MTDTSVVTLTCPAGHTHTFKTQELCGENRPLYRGPGQADADMDLVIVKCPTCRKSWEASVDCKRYK